MPFKPQTADLVARSYQLRRIAPVVTAVCLVPVLLGAIALWPGRRWRWVRRPVLVILIGATALVTWFSRQNHFEWMFGPLEHVRYVGPRDATRFLTDDEIVMGIEVSGQSLAYPIRQMAYHHLVNDMFGTVPVVVTY